MNDDHHHTDPAEAHRETWQRIPWLVNGTAAEEERRQAETHLAGCADCRDEYALQERIRDGFEAAGCGSGDAARAAFARLAARLDEAPAPDREAPVPLRRGRGTGWLQALAAAVVVQAIGLVVLVGWIVQHPPAPYRTLGNGESPAPAAVIRLVPAPALGVEELQALLVENGLRIVDGHAERAIFALAPTRPIDVGETLARLRARGDVLLAEPILGAVDARH